jgi:hypothetical protein
MKLFPGLTFSWKRALGITAAKRKISRTTGIPLTRQGRQVDGNALTSRRRRTTI